jgi:hypothetical protein
MRARPGRRTWSEWGDVAGQAFFASLQGCWRLFAGVSRRACRRCAQPISTGDLLRLLTHLQHYVPGPGEADDFDLGQQLEQLLLRVSVRSGTRRVSPPATKT